MTAEIEPRYVKGLFFQLVKLVGGVEAAGAYLGVSHQRVSQLQGIGCADMPSIMHVITLERVAGIAVVTGALADLVEPNGARKTALMETAEVVEGAGKLLNLVVNGAPQREIEAQAVALQKEAGDVPVAFQRAANHA